MGSKATGPRDRRYDALRSGFNLSVDHRPSVIIEASIVADVIDAVRMAARVDRPVAVMSTGHGPSVPADGAVLIHTGGMPGVEVDPERRTARVQAGATWQGVLDAVTPHGLAPLNGSSPHVGAVGYTLGGGVGLLARRFGFAADHVRSVDVVTADGELRHVTAHDEDLFWALRGAGANFGVVTAIEFDLFPVSHLVGGELCFGQDACEDAVHAYADWSREVPEEMASSLLLLRYPDDPLIEPVLRGQHVTHVRVAYSGDDLGYAHDLVDQLRTIGRPMSDSVRLMPYAEVGSIHHEPVNEPVAAFDRNVLLADFDHDAADVVVKVAGPDVETSFLTEIRAWGGALARPPAIPNAVGGRDAAFSLLAISDADIDHRAARDQFLDAMSPWATGMTYSNFCGVEDTSPAAVRRSYRTDDFARLRRVKSIYDPSNRFRVNFNIPPEPAQPAAPTQTGVQS